MAQSMVMVDQESQKATEMAGSSIDVTDDENRFPPSTALAEARGTGSGYENAEPSFDVGLKAWLQVLGAFFLWFNSWGIINTFGVFQTYYEDQILSHESPSSIAWIGSVQAFLVMFIGVITGPLFDAGYFYVLLPFGWFMVVFGYMMTSLSTQYYQIMLAQGICVGIGAGCMFVPSVALLPQYFQKRRAFANGIAASGSSIGGVVYPIIFYRLEQQAGFGWATRALAFVCLATCAVSVSVMRVRFPRKDKRSLLQLSAFKEMRFSLLCVALFIGFLGFYNFLSYVQPWAIQKGIASDNMAFYLLPMLNAASTFGRIAPNFAADHWGPFNVFVPAAGLTSLIAFCWIAVDSTAGVIVLTLLYGFCSGGLVSLPPVVMTSITKDLGDLGTRLGMMFSVVSIALLLGTPIGGAILDSTGSYLGVQAISGSCLVSCAVLLLVNRIIGSGPKLLYKT